MKRTIAIILIIMLCFTGCGVSAEELMVNHLEQGMYDAAYELVADNDTKNEIITENFVSVIYQDLIANSEIEIQLLTGYFGQVVANESDIYLPNDPIFAIENYAKLAEYLSLLSGRDILKDYYYGLIEVYAKEYSVTVYALASYDIESKEYKVINTMYTLEQENEDDNSKAMRKYIARELKAQGVCISEEAVKRIENLNLEGKTANITFDFDFDLGWNVKRKS